MSEQAKKVLIAVIAVGIAVVFLVVLSSGSGSAIARPTTGSGFSKVGLGDTVIVVR